MFKCLTTPIGHKELKWFIVFADNADLDTFEQGWLNSVTYIIWTV